MNKYLHLDEFQQEILEQKRSSSLLALAAKIGAEPDLLAQKILDQIKKSSNNQLHYLNSGLKVDEGSWVTGLKTLMETEDLWEALDFLNVKSNEQFLRHLSDNIEVLPLNHAYIRKLHAELDLDFSEEEPYHSTMELLKRIPQLYLFTNEFNAFVDGQSEIGGIPSICVHHCLLTTLQVLSEVVSGVLYGRADDEDGIKVVFNPLSLEEISERAGRPETIDSLDGILNLLVGDSIEESYETSFSFEDSSWMLPLFISDTAIFFVHMHEFGHFLRGHLSAGADPQIEFQADYFALTSLVKRKGDMEWVTQFHQKCLIPGLALLFIALEICELRNDANDMGYPSAQQRFAVIASWLKDAGMQRKCAEYRLRIATALNPALQRKWGFSVHCA